MPATAFTNNPPAAGYKCTSTDDLRLATEDELYHDLGHAHHLQEWAYSAGRHMTPEDAAQEADAATESARLIRSELRHRGLVD